jgi:hypothetical protein
MTLHAPANPLDEFKWERQPEAERFLRNELVEPARAAAAAVPSLRGVIDRVRACSVLIGPPDRVDAIRGPRPTLRKGIAKAPTWPREAPGYRVRAPLDLSEVTRRLPLGLINLSYDNCGRDRHYSAKESC